MQNSFPKIPFFVSIIFFLASSIAFLFFYRGINVNNRELQQREGQWQAEAERRNEIKALDNSVKIIAAERAKLETHFARSSDIVPFLDTIEGLAPLAGAKAAVTSVDILEDHAGLLVGMKASGTFGSLYKFLTLLENSPYALVFEAVDLKRETMLESVGKSSAIPEWSVVLRIKLLSFIK